jgi:hypothetical protein
MTTLITTFYQDSSPERQEELSFALQHNLHNPFLNSIVLFVEQSFPTSLLDHPKIKFVTTTSRIPTYGDFLSYAATLADGSIIIISNTDICFDHEVERIQEWDLDNRLVVLSRKEGRPGSRAFLTNHHHSSDSWIVKTPLLTSTCDISLGILHCETAFISHMQQAGYTVSNASLSVSSFHIHESGKRSYSQQGSPYENLQAQAFPLISGAFTSGLISRRLEEAPLLISTAALSGNTIGPFRIWHELLPLLRKHLPMETALLSHANQDLSAMGLPIFDGPTINPSLALQETDLLDHICMELGTSCFVATSGSVPRDTLSIAPIYNLKYELLHANTCNFRPEMFVNRFSASNFFFDETTLSQSRSYFDRSNKKNFCLLPKGKQDFFSLPDDDPTSLTSLGVNRRFLLLVGIRTGLAGEGNAECLFKALSYRKLYRQFQIVSVGGAPHLEKKLQNYPAGQDAVLLHPSDSILRKLYHHAFAHISTARIKGVELSNIEAMQCGCPVVIVQYDNPYREYWGNCISTPRLDGEALQEIVTLLEDTNTRSLIRQAGLDYTKSLSYENTAKILGEFITRIYNESKSKSQKK